MKKFILIITLLLLALTTGIALAQAPEGKEYTVQAGNSLSAIAKAEYGNPQAFPAIIAATNAKAAEDDSFTVIDNPAAILGGQKLWLPANPNFEQLAASAPTDQTATKPGLYMPRNVKNAFEKGTRNPDGNPGETYWQNKSVYTMTLDIAPPDRTISATEVITYFNNSPDTLDQVKFRLYLNIHQPKAILEDMVPEDFYTSGVQIEEFRVNGKVTPWESVPGETVHAVKLDKPLPPNESITFSFTWQYKLAPANGWKEGVVDDTTFYLAYFFPRVAVYDDVDGWEMWPASSIQREYYNDFSDFTVAINVPKNFIVWATGDLLNPKEVLQPKYAQRLAESFTTDKVINIAQTKEITDGLVTAQTDTVTWKWQANNVPDMAIGLSDHFIWDAGSIEVDSSTGRRASVQAAYNEEAVDFQQMVEVGKRALEFGSTEYPGVPYPYSKMTVFRGDADEEYPMLANDASLPDDLNLSRFVAYHEILHSWFPFYMGTNEARYPMMDEGWTTAFEYLITKEDISEAYAVEIFQMMRTSLLAIDTADTDLPIITPFDALISGHVGYAVNAYGKPALAYLALKDLMGDEAFKEALHEFMARWHGKHPLPWDMFNSFNDASGENYTWFFNNWFFLSNYIDLAVGDVQATDGGYAVQVRNVGGMAVPFDVKVVYTDDSEETFHQTPAIWQATPQTATVRINSAKELKSLSVDGGIFADVEPSDNTWKSQ